MTEWKEYKLGEFIKVKHGFAFKGDYIVPDETDKILVTPGNFHIGGGFKSDKFKYYNCEDFPQDYILKSGDIVVTMTDLSKDSDTLGYSAIIPFSKNKKYLHNQRIGLVQFISNKVCPDFVYWLLRTKEYQSYIVGSASGTSIMHTSPSRIENYSCLFPPLNEQRRIASILSSLDDKIDLLHRENATLEQMAETLFRQWFVVEAKEEWEEVPLEYVCERITDGSHYSPESVEFGLPMASVKDMENWGIDLNSCRKISKEDFDKLVSADCLPQVNDILIAKDGSYLKHIFVVDKMQEVVLLSSIAILRPNGLYHPYLLSILLKLDSTKEELKNIVTGAVIPRIVLKDFRKFPILLPPIEKQKQALSFIEPIMKKCFSNNEQIQTLIQTRDGLLPRLISGEVKI